MKFIGKFKIFKKIKKENNDKKTGEVVGQNKKIKKSKRSWIIGGSLLFLGLINIFSHLFLAVSLLFTASFVFPPIKNFIENKFKIRLNRKGKIFTTLLAIFAILILFFGPSDVERAEIAIHKGDSNPKEVVDSGQTIIDLVNDFQDAQLSTVALLSVKFETADKEEYLDYIKEVEKKWKKVEKETERLKKIKKRGGNVPTKPKELQKVSYLIHYVDAQEEFSQVSLGSFDDGNGEVSIGDDEKRVFQNIVDEAYAFKSLHPSKTSIGYLQDQMKISAKEAGELIEEYHKDVKNNWDNKTTLYDIASKTASGIAYSSKISLYALGTVASFGAAAAAETGSGVILGYMAAGAGAAIAGVDIAIDISDTASVISTGHGIVGYKKAKDVVDKASTVLLFSNIPKSAVTGLPKFIGNQFSVADDFMTVYGFGQYTSDVFMKVDGEKIKIEGGENVKHLNGETIDKILKSVKSDNFEYNKIVIAAKNTQNENMNKQTTGNPKTDSSCKIDPEYAGSEKNTKGWWPACKKGLFGKPSCSHIKNTCLVNGACICREGYRVFNNDKVPVACIPSKEWHAFFAYTLDTMYSEQSDAEWIEGMSPEVRKVYEKYSDPKLKEFSEKAMKCEQ